MRYTHKDLLKLVSKLNLRFPIAEISKKTGYSKSAVSNYMNEIKPVSKSFMENLIHAYGINVPSLEDIMNKTLDSLYNIRGMQSYHKKDTTITDAKIEVLEDVLDKYIKKPDGNNHYHNIKKRCNGKMPLL